MWDDRGHAARIKAAAKAQGLRCTIGHGLQLDVRSDTRQILDAHFSGTGILHRGSIRTSTKPSHAFAETWLTPAEATRAVVAWLEAGCPETFDVSRFVLLGGLR